MKQKIIQAGNSLAVVIPSRFVKNMGIKKGDKVSLQLNLSKGKIICFFTGIQQLALSENLEK